MNSSTKMRHVAAIASMGRRRTVIQRAWKAWKIISRKSDANGIPAQ